MPKIVGAKRTPYNGIMYRSKTEANCAELLDKYNIGFKYESFHITLTPGFKYRNTTFKPWTYTPDFIVFDNIILEVKGFRNADNYTNKRKVILKHLIDTNSPFEFYEIYSTAQLEKILKIYTDKDNTLSLKEILDNECYFGKKRKSKIKKKGKK